MEQTNYMKDFPAPLTRKTQDKKHSIEYGIGYRTKSRIWSFVNSTIFRWTPFFMRRTRVAMLKLFGANIQWNSSINNGAKIVDPWNLTIGSYSSIDEECCVRCRDKVIIGEKSCISRGVDILTGSHDISSPDFDLITAPIVIGNNVWVATKATIGMGVTIGDGAVIGAKSLVFKDVQPWTVVGGNPAKVLKMREIKNKENAVNTGLGGVKLEILRFKFYYALNTLGKEYRLLSTFRFNEERRAAA